MSSYTWIMFHVHVGDAHLQWSVLHITSRPYVLEMKLSVNIHINPKTAHLVWGICTGCSAKGNQWYIPHRHVTIAVGRSENEWLDCSCSRTWRKNCCVSACMYPCSTGYVYKLAYSKVLETEIGKNVLMQAKLDEYHVVSA